MESWEEKLLNDQKLEASITLVAEGELPIFFKNDQVFRLFAHRKEIAKTYLRTQEKSNKKAAMKHFLIINDQIKKHFNIV